MDSEEGIRDDTSSSLISAISLGVLILPLLALWTSSLSLARREDNPAPLAFTYMKIVYPVAFLFVESPSVILNALSNSARALTFQFAHLMLEIAMRWVLMPRDPYAIPLAEPHHMAYMSNRLDALSSTLLDVTDIFLILALFELGNGYLERVTEKASSFPLVVRYTLLLPAAIVLYLAIATHVQSYSIWSKSFSTDEDGERQLQEDIEKLEEWDTPLLTLWWAASFLLFLYACFIWHKAKGNAQVLSSTATFLAARVLNLFNPVRQAVVTSLDLDILGYKPINQYLYLVDNILDYWIRFLIVAHIFAMGLAGDKGLWSAISQLYSAPVDVSSPLKE
ncbi:hypothetical protein CEP54_009633 [Fusarium duplospermum]|uniref:Uncharacterized protein n=1 Tax=Fusarium duplospermum TaxID=1325734 RepID=A0A428PPG5_9HYPO|nr:hypothetical protein CEP54_009633 [Fusarium duplospermum]